MDDGGIDSHRPVGTSADRTVWHRGMSRTAPRVSTIACSHCAHEKSPDLAVRGLWHQPVFQPVRNRSNLLGCGCAGSSCSSRGISSSLGSVWGSCIGSRSCGISGRSGRSRGCWLGSRCSSRGFHRCRSGSGSGFFLLAASGECSSCDQGGQNERVLHFDFPIGTDIILKSHGVRLSEALLRFGPMHLGCTYWRSRRLYWHLVNTG